MTRQELLDTVHEVLQDKMDVDTSLSDFADAVILKMQELNLLHLEPDAPDAPQGWMVWQHQRIMHRFEYHCCMEERHVRCHIEKRLGNGDFALTREICDGAPAATDVR